MDDREKFRIREEFNARFWRLAIFIPIFSGYLLWKWLEADRHTFFLWLTVLPLVFLIPLLRYHRALRSLIDPDMQEHAEGATKSTTAELIAEAKKAEIRRTATIIHWGVQVFLLAMIVFGVYARWGFRLVADSFSNMQLTVPSSIVMSQFSPLFFGRGRELIPYPPPESPEDRLAWAQQIEEQLGQPVAVFIKEGASLTWVTRKDSLAAGVAQVPHLFESNLSRDEQGAIDTIGSYEVRRVSNLEPKGESFKAWIVGPLNRDLRWGVVLDFDDTWPKFFSSLKEAETKSPPMESPARTIKYVVDIDGNDQLSKPGMRVIRNSEILYATPKLDTTRHLYAIDSPPMRWEYYESEMNERYALFIGKSPVSWRSFVAWFVMMAGFFWFYLWIRKLTIPLPELSR